MLDSQIGCAGLGAGGSAGQCMEESLISIRVAETIHYTESSHTSTLLYHGAMSYIYSISSPMAP